MVDNEASPGSRAGGSSHSGLSRVWLAVSSPEGVIIAIAGAWFAVTFGTLLWVWGLNPLVFPSPDEAVMRFAARLVGQHGRPFLPLPFPDPEDLAHPRSWLSIGDVAIPSYAPVTFYAYAPLTRFGLNGRLLVAALPAAAVAAFAAGIARLLPLRRQWLALLGPTLAFPALYWLMRPWINVSALLQCLCWAFFYWASWRALGAKGWLVAAILSVGVAAAVRPDYAAFVLVSVLLVTIAESPSQWKLVLLLVVVAGAGALGINLILNKAVTGHAFRAANQIAEDRTWGPQASHGFPGLAVLKVLLIPMGLPAPKVAATAFLKYWVKMGPIALILLAQLAQIPLLRAKAPSARLLYLTAILWAVFLAFGRMHDDVYGGRQSEGWVDHSVPRYLTPLYLFAALPPLVFLGQCRVRWMLAIGATLACLVSASALDEIWFKQRACMTNIRNGLRSRNALLQQLKTEIPPDAMVYTKSMDKVLWSEWRLGTIDAPEATSTSIGRAVAAGLLVFVYDVDFVRQAPEFAAIARNKSLRLVKVTRRRGLYRVDPRAAVSPEN